MHLREISNSKELKGYEGVLSAPLELIPWPAGKRGRGLYDRFRL
jgi:hypothetical protein